MTSGPAGAASAAAAPPRHPSAVRTTGLPARLLGVLRHPRRTFRELAASPRWLGVLILLTAVAAAANAALLSTEVGQQALVDQWERTAIAFGQPVDDARYAEFQALSENGPAYGVLTALATVPLGTLVVAALIYVTGRRVQQAGGGVTFRQVLAVVSHAAVILALRQLIAAPVNYTRETTTSPASMALFFTMVDEASPAARFFGVLDLFVLWWLLVVAIGAAVLYAVPIRRVLYPLVGLYVGCAVLLASVMALTGGTG